MADGAVVFITDSIEAGNSRVLRSSLERRAVSADCRRVRRARSGFGVPSAHVPRRETIEEQLNQ